MYKLGLDINIDKISWNILDENHNLKDCGCFVIDISPEDRENFLRGEKIQSYNLNHLIKRRRKQYQSYKQRRDRLIKKLVDLEFCNNNILNKKLDRTKIFELRNKAQKQEISKEEFALICLHFNKNRGYLHNRIVDYSTILNLIEEQDLELNNSKKTLSKFLFDKINENNHSVIKKYIFSRKKQKEDFNLIFQIQAKYKNIFTPALCVELRDRIIFYQKDFKFSNQKYNDCPFEKFHKNTHISNPFFLDFMIWKELNKLIIYDKKGLEYILDISTKRKLFNFIKTKKEITGTEILKELENLGDLEDYNSWCINKNIIKGNFFRYELIEILTKHKIDNHKINLLTELDYKNNNLDQQALFDIWHSVYSIYDIKGLEKKLLQKYSLPLSVVKKITEIRLNEKIHFGYLSTKACRKLIIEMQEGFMYSMACKKLGYVNYNKIKLSKSLKKEIPLHRLILNRLELLLTKIKEIYPYKETNILIDKNLTISKEMRKKRIEYIINLREQKKECTSLLKKNYNIDYISGKNIEKYNLYKEVLEFDFIKKQPINIKNLFTDEYVVENILEGENCIFYSNKVLTNKKFSNSSISFFNKIEDKEFYLNFFNTKIKGNVPTEKYLKYLGTDMSLNFSKLSFFEERLKILISKYSDNINIIELKNTLKTINDYNFVNILKNIEYSKFKNSEKENLIDITYNLQGEKIERLKKWKKIYDTRYFIIKSIIANIPKNINIIYIEKLKKDIEIFLYNVIIFNEKKDNIIYSKQNNPIKQLHRDILYGKIKRKEKVFFSIKLNQQIIENICNPDIKNIILNRLKQYNFDIKKSFSKKEIEKNPIIFKNQNIDYFYYWKEIFVTKKEVNKYLPVDKIVDKNLKENLSVNLKLNGVNSVRVEDISNNLHNLKNKSFVYLRDNHHISVFKNNNKLLCSKTTYWEVFHNKLKYGKYIKDFYNNESEFLFSLRINDYILFTEKEINFNDISFENKKYISDNTYRVQKLTIKSSGQPYFWFRHHKENTLNNDNIFSVKIISSLNSIKGYKLNIDIFGKINYTQKLL